MTQHLFNTAISSGRISTGMGGVQIRLKSEADAVSVSMPKTARLTGALDEIDLEFVE